jgi:hypothetical protein
MRRSLLRAIFFTGAPHPSWIKGEDDHKGGIFRAFLALRALAIDACLPFLISKTAFS